MSQPVWLTELEAVALNHRLIGRFGGLGGGPRDESLLQAALARSLNKWHYDEPRPDLFELAAAYAFAIARGHVFRTATNGRLTRFAAVFLANHGIEHRAPEDEVVAVMVALAEGALSETEFAIWLRDTSQQPA